MAKKAKTAKKAKPARSKPKTRSALSAKSSIVKRGARSQPLPGMEQIRSGRLDNYCEAIAEDRATMAKARADESGSIQGALREMKARGLSGYKHAGVELAFVPGADKLRVRLTKDASDASTTIAGEGGEVGGGDGVPADAGAAGGDDFVEGVH